MSPARDTSDSESFGQFLARLNDVFPVRRQAAWSAAEQAVFNGLVARAIQRHGHDGLSRSLLEELARDMEGILRRCELDSGGRRGAHGQR